MPFAAGQRVRASDLNQIGKLVGRNSRTSNITSTGPAVAVLSVRAPVVAGRSYRCTLLCESYGSVAANNGQHEVCFTTNDTEPTTGVGQPILFRALVNHAVVGIPVTVYTEGVFDCTATGFLRLLHRVSRTSGTGNASAASGAGFPELLMIEDIGETVASSGTVY